MAKTAGNETHVAANLKPSTPQLNFSALGTPLEIPQATPPPISDRAVMGGGRRRRMRKGSDMGKGTGKKLQGGGGSQSVNLYDDGEGVMGRGRWGG